ncbi:MAG: GNAT family N-acetyltransferase [Opitutales bacterium]
MSKRFFGRPFIEMLWVSEDERRQGHGAALLDRLVRIGLRSGEVWTSANQSNRSMQRLLKRHGFLWCGRVSGLDAGDPELFYVTRKP